MKIWTVPELEGLKIDWIGLPDRFWQEDVIKAFETIGFFVAYWGDNKGYPCYTGCIPIKAIDSKELLNNIESVKLTYRKSHKSITKKLRFLILKRDNFTCQMCGRTPSDGVKLEVDHKIPISRGGITKESNLWVSCFDCNRGKSNILL